MLVLFLGAARCSEAPSQQDPCELDSIACRTPSGFEIDTECMSTEPLEVAIGQGADAFEPVDVPEVHYGSQGGRHLFAAIRVENPDLEHATFQAFIQLEASAEADSAPLTERAVVFSVDDATEQPGGGFDLVGLVLVLPEVELSGPGRLMLDARDTCDRRGRATAQFEWP
jgi:hypothetical protein